MVSPDLHLEEPGLLVLLDIDVDGKVSVNVAHLVLVALGYADDQVVNESLDRAKCGNVLSRAMVQFNGNCVFVRVGEADSEVL